MWQQRPKQKKIPQSHMGTTDIYHLKKNYKQKKYSAMTDICLA